MPFLLVGLAALIAGGAYFLLRRNESGDTLLDEVSVSVSKLTEAPSSSASDTKHTTQTEDRSSWPLGLRNHNPTNVKGTGWVGQQGSDKYGHAIFDSDVHGLRAAMKNLKTYFVSRGADTVSEILSGTGPSFSGWAGAEAPNINAYKSFVASQLRVSTTQPLTWETHVIPLAKAISEFEQGSKAYAIWNPPDSLFVEAKRLAS